MNLFSVFDPSVFGFQLNWIIMLMVIFLFPFSFFFFFSGMNFFSFSMVGMMSTNFSEIGGLHYSVLVIVCVSLMVCLLFNNFVGLFSFVFTVTAHPMITLSLGLSCWVSFFLMGWIKNFSKSSVHLTPEGSPLMLAPLLVLVEVISHLIRPFTLAIRLAANMMAGHLIIGLLASLSLVSKFSFFVSLFLQVILFVLECGVAVIQAMVFSILLLLYVLEYY